MVRLNRIKGLMAENNDTQEKLAERLNVSKQLISLKLNGKSAISIEMLTAIARVYGIPVAELIED